METGYSRVNAGRLIGVVAPHCGEEVLAIDEDPPAVSTDSACTNFPCCSKPAHLSRGAPKKCTGLAESQKRRNASRSSAPLALQRCDDALRDSLREVIQQGADQPKRTIVYQLLSRVLVPVVLLGAFSIHCTLGEQSSARRAGVNGGSHGCEGRKQLASSIRKLPRYDGQHPGPGVSRRPHRLTCETSRERCSSWSWLTIRRQFDTPCGRLCLEYDRHHLALPAHRGSWFGMGE